MWERYDNSELMQAARILKSEVDEIEAGKSVFFDDRFFTAKEKKEIELSDLRSELATTWALIYGKTISSRAAGPLDTGRSGIVMYPEIADIRALKRLLVLFDEVAVVMPFARTEELHPDIAEVEREIPASRWAPSDERVTRELDDLINHGLVKIISLRPDDADGIGLFQRLYDNSLRPKLEQLDNIQQAGWVNSSEFEFELRLLECTTIASRLGKPAISGESETYDKALTLQRHAWMGTPLSDRVFPAQDPSKCLGTGAILSVLANTRVPSTISLDELLELRQDVRRKKLIQLVDNIVASTSSDMDSDKATMELLIEFENTKNSFSRTRSLFDLAVPIISSILTISTGGAVGILTAAAATLTGLFSITGELSRARGSDKIVSAANYFANLK